MSNETGPEDRVDKLDRAIALHNEGMIAEAMALYSEVLSGDPENSNALHLLGLCNCLLYTSPSPRD